MEKKILVINTGGTLSSIMGKKGLSPGMGRKELMAKLEMVSADCNLFYEDFFSLDSANIQPDDWSKMAAHIADVYKNYHGIVIIHGTDTMAYTSSMLSFMLKGIPVPVVITGSQLAISHPVADAYENLRTAIYMAAKGYPGVFLAFNRKIMLGTRASKVRSMSFDAFESINFPYAAEINAYGMRTNMSIMPVAEENFKADVRYDDSVFLLKLIPGMRDDIFEALHMMGYRGVIVEAFGLGGVSYIGQNISRGIGQAVKSGMSVFIGGQCRYDGSDLSVYETGRRSLEYGAGQLYDMTAEAAVTKLMWILGHETDSGRIAEEFGRNLVNEVEER